MSMTVRELPCGCHLKVDENGERRGLVRRCWYVEHLSHADPNTEEAVQFAMRELDKHLAANDPPEPSHA